MRYKHILLFSLLLLFLVSCKSKDFQRKIEYNGKLSYFTDRNGYEHLVFEEDENGISIVLPECFKKQQVHLMSLTDAFSFFCDKNATYITVDIIPKEYIQTYKKYFDEKDYEFDSELDLLREYVISTRQQSLNNTSRAGYSNIKTDTQNDLLLGSVSGTFEADSKEVFYQYGFLEVKDQYYVLQSIMDMENSLYLTEDVIKIFKTAEER